VGAAPIVSRVPGGLDGELGEQGGGLSAGERALLCLARAVLRQERGLQPQRSSRAHADAAAAGSPALACPTLVLADEPTSSVDLVADAVVHDTLLALPQTVLCICHRLHHVPRFDLVAVLADGAVAELASPAELAARPGSRYAELIASAERSKRAVPAI
jgi:ABC-type multidrug transport system fused ATPase/permease subunit